MTDQGFYYPAEKKLQNQDRDNINRSALELISDGYDMTIPECDGQTTVVSSGFFKFIDDGFFSEAINKPSKKTEASSAKFYKLGADSYLSGIFNLLADYEIFQNQHQAVLVCKKQMHWLRQGAFSTLLFILKDIEKPPTVDNVFALRVRMSKEGFFAEYAEADDESGIFAAWAEHRMVLNQPILTPKVQLFR